MIQPVASSTSSTCSPCAFLSSSESRVLSTSVLFHCSVENIQKKHAVSCFIMYLEKFNNFFAKHCWLVVLTILKSISQWEGLSHILWKIKHVWNHQPDWHCTSDNWWADHLWAKSAPDSLVSRLQAHSLPFFSQGLYLVAADIPRLSHGTCLVNLEKTVADAGSCGSS